MLAYSGGLDTSVAVRWLIEKMARGDRRGRRRRPGRRRGREHWEAIRERALGGRGRRGRGRRRASEMAEDFCVPAVQANARYEGKYPLVSALSRPVIVRHLVARGPAARRRHRGPRLHRQGQRPGALRGRHPGPRPRPRRPGPGPGLGPVAGGLRRVRGRSGRSRSTVTTEKLYSIDENLWGRAIECGAIEDPWAAAARRRLRADP